MAKCSGLIVAFLKGTHAGGTLHNSWQGKNRCRLVRPSAKVCSEAVGREWRWAPRTLQCVGAHLQPLSLNSGAPVRERGGILPGFSLRQPWESAGCSASCVTLNTTIQNFQYFLQNYKNSDLEKPQWNESGERHLYRHLV